jgi:hypothetical protein
MNYINYDTCIVIKYNVRLAGWPSTIKFGNPSTIGTVDDIRTLRTALQVGSCKWIILTGRQQAAHLKSVEALKEAGTVVGKKRKVRCDKGRKRKNPPNAKPTRDEVGKQGEEEEEEDEEDEDEEAREAGRVAKKRREKYAAPQRRKKVVRPARKSKSQIPPLPKRKMLVDSDDDISGDSD